MYYFRFATGSHGFTGSARIDGAASRCEMQSMIDTFVSLIFSTPPLPPPWLHFLFLLLRRRCWCTLVLSCLLLAIIHGAGLIRRYQSYQTRVQLHVYNKQSLAVPDITVCPMHRFDLLKLNQLWTQHFGHSKTAAIDPTSQYYQLNDLMDVHTLWRRIAYGSVDDMIPVVRARAFTT